MTTRVSSPSIARENTLMRSVVRNVVVNMECVLDDLRGIMGEITTIVAHIDSVTEKIDDTYKSPKGIKGSLGDQKENSSAVNSKSCLDNPVQKSVNLSQEKRYSSADRSQQHAVRTQVYSLKRSMEDVPLMNYKETLRPRCNEELITVPCESKNELSNASRRFHQFQNDRGGAVAIVYPTIIIPHVNQTEMSRSSLLKQEDFTHKTYATMAFPESIQHDISRKQCNVKGIITTDSLENQFQTERMKIKEKETKQVLGKKTIYNKDFQPLMTSEKSYLVAETMDPCYLPYNVNQCPVSSNLKNAVFNSSGKCDVYMLKDNNPQQHQKVSATTGNSVTPFSLQSPALDEEKYKGFNIPQLKHSEVNQLYTRDPTVHGQSSDARRHSKFDSCYYSTESDLDSDSTSDYSNRCLTPDIDWSYLNLLGSRYTQQEPTKAPYSTSCTQHCDMSAVSVSQTADATRHAAVDTAMTSPEISASSVLKLKKQFNVFSNPDLQMDKHVPSQYRNHMFCCEVNSSDSDGYCGYYEAIVDAVLENIAGFEPFEEDCKDMSSIEALHESCLSFDNEFEEDDLDVGIKSDDQDEYEMASDYGYGLPCQEETAFGIMGSSQNSNKIFVNLWTNDNNLLVLDSGTKSYDGNEKQKLPETMTRLYIIDDQNATKTKEELLIDEHRSNVRRRVNLTKTHHQICGMTVIPDDDNDAKLVKIPETAGPKTTASTFDILSLATIRSLSPMSLSSSDTTYTSRETDHLETSSDGNDFMTSQDDLQSLSSETRFNLNSSIHKAKMKRLRRKFFQSLYTTGESTDRREDESRDSMSTSDERSTLI